MSDLQRTARDVRLDVLHMIQRAGSGHLTSSLSVVDLLVYLFFGRMREPTAGGTRGDRLILSKGHAAPALYSVLCRLGALDRAELEGLRRVGSPLQGHPDRVRLPAVQASTGSLGQGLSIAQGMAMAARALGTDRRVYCVAGDGELQEGQMWEALMSAGHLGLENLYLVIDWNEFQSSGRASEILDLSPVLPKLESFRWACATADGHDFKDLDQAFERLDALPGPKALVARTVKGKGVPFIEGGHHHGSTLSDEEEERARRVLSGREE